MALRILVLPAARQDIVEATDHIALDSREGAQRWFQGVWRAMFALADAPLSFVVIPEAAELGTKLHHAHFHSHRIVFRVKEP